MLFKAREIEDLERPRKRRRRNSDSNLYRKARGEDEESRESEKKQKGFLAEDKYAFVQRYLENVHETHSATTETSDSGIKTHGAPSELGMEDISGNFYQLLFWPVLDTQKVLMAGKQQSECGHKGRTRKRGGKWG